MQLRTSSCLQTLKKIILHKYITLYDQLDHIDYTIKRFISDQISSSYSVGLLFPY